MNYSPQLSDVGYKINIGSGASGALGWCNFDNSSAFRGSERTVHIFIAYL